MQERIIIYDFQFIFVFVLGNISHLRSNSELTMLKTFNSETQIHFIFSGKLC